MSSSVNNENHVIPKWPRTPYGFEADLPDPRSFNGSERKSERNQRAKYIRRVFATPTHILKRRAEKAAKNYDEFIMKHGQYHNSFTSGRLYNTKTRSQKDYNNRINTEKPGILNCLGSSCSGQKNRQLNDDMRAKFQQIVNDRKLHLAKAKTKEQINEIRDLYNEQIDAILSKAIHMGGGSRKRSAHHKRKTHRRKTHRRKTHRR